MRIGVMALQGDFAAHCEALRRVGAEAVEVRTARELEETDALVLPGGESTTMLKLLRLEGLDGKLADYGRRKPIFGTCAGAILLAKHVSSPAQESLGMMDLDVERNAYGRQIDSRVVTVHPEPGAQFDEPVEAVFIRAPIIRKSGPGVRVLIRYNGDPVLVEEGRHMVATFHPELTADSRVHQYFLEKVKGQARA
ncbi:MAG: pyridoxal 5'-phosphate synthase glutaminase subunit PdxT [Candidatus Solibacter usitatus]|nr:pyridoxal 5'-phosphate synthase glutaminase subunit PdxT [Candidatus Solibacter usitatus]